MPRSEFSLGARNTPIPRLPSGSEAPRFLPASLSGRKAPRFTLMRTFNTLFFAKTREKMSRLGQGGERERTPVRDRETTTAQTRDFPRVKAKKSGRHASALEGGDGQNGDDRKIHFPEARINLAFVLVLSNHFPRKKKIEVGGVKFFAFVLRYSLSIFPLTGYNIAKHNH